MTNLSQIFDSGCVEGTSLPHKAFVAIDVQRGFCDPSYQTKRGTDQTANIAQNISSFHSALQKISFPCVLAYADRKALGIHQAQGGLFGIGYVGWDLILSKQRDSLFSDQNTHNNESLLKKHGYNHLVIAGFNANACVKTSVFEARLAGFSITILSDLIGHDNTTQAYFNISYENAIDRAFEGYKKAGAEIMTSQEFLHMAHGLTPQIHSFSPHP